MRKLELKINDKNYTLEMNRDSIKWLEMNGFSLEKFDEKPVTYYDLLWTCLFVKNHKEVNQNLALKLMDTYKENGKQVGKVIKFALEEYQSFIRALTDIDSTETDEDLKITEV